MTTNITARETITAAAEAAGWIAPLGTAHHSVTFKRDGARMTVWFTNRGAVSSAARGVDAGDRLTARDAGKLATVLAWIGEAKAPAAEAVTVTSGGVEFADMGDDATNCDNYGQAVANELAQARVDAERSPKCSNCGGEYRAAFVGEWVDWCDACGTGVTVDPTEDITRAPATDAQIDAWIDNLRAEVAEAPAAKVVTESAATEFRVTVGAGAETYSQTVFAATAEAAEAVTVAAVQVLTSEPVSSVTSMAYSNRPYRTDDERAHLRALDLRDATAYGARIGARRDAEGRATILADYRAQRRTAEADAFSAAYDSAAGLAARETAPMSTLADETAAAGVPMTDAGDMPAWMRYGLRRGARVLVDGTDMGTVVEDSPGVIVAGRDHATALVKLDGDRTVPRPEPLASLAPTAEWADLGALVPCRGVTETEAGDMTDAEYDALMPACRGPWLHPIADATVMPATEVRAGDRVYVRAGQPSVRVTSVRRYTEASDAHTVGVVRFDLSGGQFVNMAPTSRVSVVRAIGSDAPESETTVAAAGDCDGTDGSGDYGVPGAPAPAPRTVPNVAEAIAAVAAVYNWTEAPEADVNSVRYTRDGATVRVVFTPCGGVVAALRWRAGVRVDRTGSTDRTKLASVLLWLSN